MPVEGFCHHAGSLRSSAVPTHAIGNQIHRPEGRGESRHAVLVLFPLPRLAHRAHTDREHLVRRPCLELIHRGVTCSLTLVGSSRQRAANSRLTAFARTPIIMGIRIMKSNANTHPSRALT